VEKARLALLHGPGTHYTRYLSICLSTKFDRSRCPGCVCVTLIVRVADEIKIRCTIRLNVLLKYCASSGAG
jgi:hypothetical protein